MNQVEVSQIGMWDDLIHPNRSNEGCVDHLSNLGDAHLIRNFLLLFIWFCSAKDLSTLATMFLD